MSSMMPWLPLVLLIFPSLPGAAGIPVVAGAIDCNGLVRITFSRPLGLTDQVGTFQIPSFLMSCYFALVVACDPPLQTCDHDPCPSDPQLPCTNIGCPPNTLPPDVCDHFSGVPGQATSAGYYGNCVRAFLHGALEIPAGKNDAVDVMLLGGVAVHASQALVNTSVESGSLIGGSFQGILVPDAGSSPCALSGGICNCTLAAGGVGEFG